MPPREPPLIEATYPGPDGWVTWWYCDPPPKHQPFVCVRDAWHADDTIRSIYEIRLVDKHESPA